MIPSDSRSSSASFPTHRWRPVQVLATAWGLETVDISALAPDARAWRGEVSQLPLFGRTDWLDVEETRRMRRFRLEQDAMRFATSRMLLRGLLAAAIGLAPQDVRWRIGAHGKPHLPEAQDLCFNVSHSDDHLLLALSATLPIGADVEAGSRLADDDFADLADRCFTDAERAELMAMDQSMRRESFLRCWARKEACLKAIGSGLSIEPNTFEVGLRPARARVLVPLGTSVCAVAVTSLLVAPGAEGAIAVLEDNCRHLAL